MTPLSGASRNGRHPGIFFGLLLFLLLSGLTLSVRAQSPQAERVLRIGVYNFAPIISMDAEGRPRGLYVDLLEHVAAKERWKLEYVNGTWQESLDRIQRGEIDLQPSIGRTPAREEKLDFNQEAMFLDWGIVYRQKGRILENVTDLAGMRIAALKGSVYTEGLRHLLQQFGVGFTLVEKSEYAQVLQAIERHEVDAGIITKVFGLTLEGRYPSIESTTIYFSPVKILFAAPKDRHREVIEALDRQFAELKADHSSIYYELHDKWIGGSQRKAVLPAWFPYSAAAALFLLAFLFASRRVLQRQVTERTRHLEAALATVRQREASLRGSEQRFRDMVNNSEGIVWEADARTFAFSFVSQKAVSLLGYALEDWCLPEFWEGRLHPEDRDWAPASRARFAARAGSYAFEYRFVAADGRTVWLHDLVTTAEEGGEPRWLRGIMIDITERKRIERELQRLNRELDQRVQERTAQLEDANAMLAASARDLARSNAELEQFAYVASHDLQEPLRMVTGFVGLLEKRLADRLDAETREFMAFVVDGSQRMRNLIQDILAYSRVSTKGAALEAVDSGAALKDALAALEGRIGETGAEVHASEMPAVMADRTQLTQLFQNLIGNAVKFCTDGAPRVRIEARRQGDQWRFSVGDNGIGIAAEYRERIFGIFQRLHNQRTFSGTGIGLAICKRIVERHGGQIGVEPAPGGGSVFWFTLAEGGGT